MVKLMAMLELVGDAEAHVAMARPWDGSGVGGDDGGAHRVMWILCADIGGRGVVVELMGQQWRPRADSGTGGDDGAGGGCWSSCGDGGGREVMLEVMG